MGLALFFTLFLVFLNGFFVAAEFALVKVRASQIEIKAKTGSRVAKIAKHMTRHLDGYLAATQLGITLASLGLGWVGEEVMTRIVSNFFNLINIDMTSSVATNIGHVLAFAIITVLHIVFGELAPKSLAIQRPIGTTMGIALPLHFFYLIFRPFIWLLNGFANFILRLLGIATIGGHEAHHSSEELQYLLDQGKESGALETNEHELIKNVFDFNN
jgi:CBS domain containing-hemolysin-like protein